VWVQEPLWTIWRRGRFVAPTGLRTPDSPARSLVTTITGPFRLHCHSSHFGKHVNKTKQVQVQHNVYCRHGIALALTDEHFLYLHVLNPSTLRAQGISLAPSPLCGPGRGTSVFWETTPYSLVLCINVSGETTSSLYYDRRVACVIAVWIISCFADSTAGIITQSHSFRRPVLSSLISQSLNIHMLLAAITHKNRQ